MCKCAITSYEILEQLNKKRKKIGMNSVSYDWMMINNRKKFIFLSAKKKAGNSYLWDQKTADRIISRLLKIPSKSYVSYSKAA